MDNDRGFRRLNGLEQSASTARVLNLLAIHRKLGADQELVRSPFFTNRLLNQSIILKHRLRPNEYSQFASPRPTATKILLPIDRTDLKVGAQFFFVGQDNFDELMASAFGVDLKPGSRDRSVLEMIDGLPSLDPFLLKEHLRGHGIEPARAYFSISDSDIQRMFEFVRSEITALVALSSAGDGRNVQAHASRLVDKLLSNAPDGGFEPLKQTLKLSEPEYLDGVFSWRGFLYYKWVLTDLRNPLREVADEVARTMGRGPNNPETSAYIPEAKKRIHANLMKTSQNVEAMIDIYNKAYAALTVDSQPAGFRSFLLSAPSMFASLGEQLGAIQHILSFWRYRFPRGKSRLISPVELMDVLQDFEDSMAFSDFGPADTAKMMVNV